MTSGHAVRGALLLAWAVGSWAACSGVACGAEALEDPQSSGAMSRCTQLGELLACYDALNRYPNDPDLLVAEADDLLRLKRAGEAIGVYRNALTVGAKRDAVTSKIIAARALRRALLNVCLKHTGVAAERACEAAWLPGAPDEVAVFKRRGMLLASLRQPSAALDAYMSAARLAPKDPAVARAILALSSSTGRRDASTLQAVAAAKEQTGAHAFSSASSMGRRDASTPRAIAAARDRLRVTERATAANSSAVNRAQKGSAATGAAATGSAAGSAAAADGEGTLDTYSNDAEITRSN